MTKPAYKHGYWTRLGSVICYTLGKVGIGTNTPTEALEVVGAVKATSFIGDGSQLTGVTGGASGVDGLSAYEIAVDNGFVGTEAEWLESLAPASDTYNLIFMGRIGTGASISSYGGTLSRNGNTYTVQFASEVVSSDYVFQITSESNSHGVAGHHISSAPSTTGFSFFFRNQSGTVVTRNYVNVVVWQV